MSIEQPLNNIQFTRSETPRAKKELWQKKMEEVDHIVDAVGEHIDAGIKNTVVAFDLLGLPTSASCEGHLDHGYCAPWVDVSAPGKPARYIGEHGVYQRIAEKYGISVEDVQRGRNIVAFNEFDEEASKNGETAEYKKWREENEILRGKADTLLQEFYCNRTVSDNLRLVTKGIDAGGEFRVHNGGSDYETDHDNLNDGDKKQLTIRLGQYQKEMQDFTRLLRQKYCLEGENALHVSKEGPESLSMSKETLLQVIGDENKKETLDYFDVKAKLEKLAPAEVKELWARTVDTLKRVGMFDHLSEEGIDIFDLGSYRLPYPLDFLTKEQIQEKFNIKAENIGGFYRDGRVTVSYESEDHHLKDIIESIASLASGNGLGGKMETIVHETYHGFQDIDPKEAMDTWQQISRLEGEIKIEELRAKIQDVPAYKVANLRARIEELKDNLKNKSATNKKQSQSDEVYEDAMLLREVHANLFSNPLKRLRHIKSSSEADVINAYYDTPIRELHERMLGVKREDEDKEHIIRYDYIKQHEDRAIVAFRQIEMLRALGLNNLEIGRVISEDSWDETEGLYRGLRAKIKEVREFLGIGSEELSQKTARYQLELVFRTLKTRNTIASLI